jgi:hypothetical protein
LNEIANAITTQIGSWIGVIETVEKAKAKGREVGFQFAHRQARRVTKGRILSMFAFIYRKPSTAFVGLVGLPEAHVKGFLRSAAEAMMGEGVEVNEHAWSWQGK